MFSGAHQGADLFSSVVPVSSWLLCTTASTVASAI